MRSPRGPVVWLLAALLGLAAAAATAEVRRVEIGGGAVATHTAENELYLEALPERGEGLLAFSRRLTGSSENASRISEANRGARQLHAGVRYRVPFRLLLPEHQVRVVRALFRQDRVEKEGWRHSIGAGPVRESLWHVAEWFTGRGDNYREIRRVNRLFDDHLEPGQSVLIPARLLRPGLRSALPESSRFYLQYGADGRGDYAVYRLKPGEALYSSVVVRFTGNVFADDVNALAAEIAERSGIRDVTDIPVGYAVKVPFDLLLPEFLPAGHPRRQEYEAGVLDSARFGNRVRADRLRGVRVILDSGHGGADVGASLGGVWESLYVYDIMLRVKRLLETTTAADVTATVQDGRRFAIPDRDVLPYSRGHRVLTDPPYPIADSKVGLHLRWYLANSVFRRSLEGGGEAERVVFLSIHADSLHPSLRGAMVYIPGARYRTGSFGKAGSVYASRREVRERPRVSFSGRELARSEGLSRELAVRVLDAFAGSGLEVHREKPIREKVIRQRRAWVPAVLRFNEVPAKVLVEVCNLANAADRKLLQTRAFREKVAQALVDGLVGYYDVGTGTPGVRVARTAR